MISKIYWLMVMVIFCAAYYPLCVYAAPTLNLSDTGTGINEIVTVDSAGQFRLIFKASQNWGIAAYYDLVNDPSATTNLTDESNAYPGNPPPAYAVESGLVNQCFDPTSDMPDYATANDAKSFIGAAGIYQPSTPRSFSIIENSPSRVVVKATYFPMIGTVYISEVQNSITYYIYPNGKIYLHNTFTNLTGTDYSFYDIRPMYLGLNDPTTYTGSIPDTQGWMRADQTQNPLQNFQSYTANYLFAYWNPSTPSPYTNFTKANFLLVPNLSNVWNDQRLLHMWPGYKRLGFERQNDADHTAAIATIKANSTLAQDYLLQVGTQGSSVLPNITNSTIADPIANAYLANPTPPSPQQNAILDYNGNADSTTVNWINSKFSWDIGSGPLRQPASGLVWSTYFDLVGPGAVNELLSLKDWVTSNGLNYEHMLLHSKTDWTFTGDTPTAWSQMDMFDNFEGANGVLTTSDDATFTDLTTAAYTGSVTWQNHMYIGYEEPFDQINLMFSTAGTGITRMWEYWNDSSWATLATSGTASGLTATGQVSFTPPSTWARKVINNSRNKYFVRCRITAATTSPVTSSIKGDDWLVNHAANAPRGWDSTSGTIINSDQLTYNPTPTNGASARFPYQARIPYFGPNHFVANFSNYQNISSVSKRSWAAYAAYQISSLSISGYNAVMGDDGERSLNHDGIDASNTDFSSSNSYSVEQANMYGDVVSYSHVLSPAVKVGINAQTKGTAIKGDWNLAEFHTSVWKTGSPDGMGAASDPTQAMGYDDYLSGSLIGVLIYNDANSGPKDGVTWDQANRGPIAALSKHYIGQNNNTRFVYDSTGSYYGYTDEVIMKDGTTWHQATRGVPTLANVQRWTTFFPAMGVDIGLPDPTGNNGGARNRAWNGMWRRDYTGAIVLHNPAYWDTTASAYNTPGTSNSLGGTYYPLMADGTTGSGITSIALRTGEGAILMKSPLTGSATSSPVPPAATKNFRIVP